MYNNCWTASTSRVIVSAPTFPYWTPFYISGENKSDDETNFHKDKSAILTKETILESKLLMYLIIKAS